MADPDCIFCKIVAGEIPASIVDEDERTIAFMDIAPATRGHALVIPRAHSSDLLGIEREDLEKHAAQQRSMQLRHGSEVEGDEAAQAAAAAMSARPMPCLRCSCATTT